ncbi:hypothetical protein IV203_003570 [Nitzschia inconspicua]|uniref:Uncharacterized protein n=1 Tax=Nitzschia inconspicua TaxID=303405 RepID=A0A9K3L273_9STRA|nr:hypothetical protein IV203_003570 [Nitzschia inconspicua]
MSILANVTMSCKQVSDGDAGVMPPFIVACGHQRIIVPKTGNTFPALCVCVPDTNHSCSLVWRSKRDFLLLARSTNNTQFPKAAFQRLTEENVVPWIRRPVEEVFQGTGQTETARREAIQQIDSFHESCFSLPNKYQVKMKKSVWQLDTFLQSTAKQVGQVSSSADKNVAAAGWATFCRPEDTEGLVSCVSRSSNVVNDDVDVQDRHQSITSSTLQESSRLGQYFASPENSQQVADAAMKLASSNLIDHNSTLPFHYLFVEPSCGHGDILVELLKRLQHHRISPEIVTIVGYDIDPHAIAICQQRREFLESSYKGCFHWRHGNFLESRKELFPVGGNRSRLATICLGGPPYTSGAGSSKDIQRNLPTLFIQHCQDEWEADCIAFLLPERYRAVGCITDDSWHCETQDLQSSTFYFRGTEKVTQPSILQILCRRRVAASGEQCGEQSS